MPREPKTSKCFTFRHYTVLCDSRQYILQEKNSTNTAFLGTLQCVFEEMYAREQKNAVRTSESLTEAIKRLEEMHKSFLKEIEPLRALKP